MGIRQGILLIGAKNKGIGKSGAVEGFADIDGKQEPVFAKKLPEKKIFAEILSAKIGMLIGLRCAEPLLLLGQEDRETYFGSIKIHENNFSQHLKIVSPDLSLPWAKKFAEILHNWPSFALAVAFDESIKNIDRNTQNILWSDSNDYFLIDHDNTFDLNKALPNKNKILEHWLSFYFAQAKNCEFLRKKIVKNARAQLISSKQNIRQIIDELNDLDDQNILSNFYETLESQLENLPLLINNRFPGSLFSEKEK